MHLDDVSPSYIQGFERPEASHELVRKARDVLNEARIAADRAAAAHYKSAQRTKDGCHIADIAGWAHLVVHGGQTPLVSALFELDAIYPVAGEGYYFREIGGLGWNGDQALSLAEAAVEGAKEVFRRNFPNGSFSMATRGD